MGPEPGGTTGVRRRTGDRPPGGGRAAGGAGTTRLLADLQARAGNAAVTGLIRASAVGGPGGPRIHRHGSAEHALMGDADPTRIGAAVAGSDNRAHLLNEEYRRALYFKADPYLDPRQQFPDIRWVQLMGTAADGRPVWVSFGELNALADYLPDGDTIDHLPHATLLPVLQRMRGIIANDAQKAITDVRQRDNSRGQVQVVTPAGGVTIPTFEGDDASIGGQWASSPHNHPVIGMASKAAAEVSDLDDATATLGSARYQGLLSRNACHFAPYSWQRWQHFHNEAIEQAREHHRLSADPAVGRSIDVFTEEHARRAILAAGYGDHFLEDSFAAGHLINKTLVMQWFAEWLGQLPAQPGPGYARFGLTDPHPTRNLPRGVTGELVDTVPALPGIGGRSLYQQGGTVTDGTATDRTRGDGPTDPQSAEERASLPQRIGGSGVTATPGRTADQNYQTYLGFLDSTFINLGAGAMHDWLNERGVTVVNGRTMELVVGGDGTYLSRSDRAGAEAVAAAAQLSRRAVDDVLTAGVTMYPTDVIFSWVPVKVTAVAGLALPGGPVGLEQWNDTYVRTFCRGTLFPGALDSITNGIAASAHPQLVAGGSSRDSRR
jgi:hypothetical protein